MSNSEEYLYIGKRPRFDQDVRETVTKWRQSLKHALVTKDVNYFGTFASKIRDLERETEGRIPQRKKWLISDEGILSRSLGPHPYGNLVFAESAYHIVTKIAEIRNRNSDLNVSLIVVIRKQTDFLHSYLAENYRLSRKYQGIRSMEELVDHLLADGSGGTADSLLHYEKFIAYCDRLLGKDNVLILPYEMMSTSPQDFLQKWSNFMGISDFKTASAIEDHRENQRKVSATGKKTKSKSLYSFLRSAKKRAFGSRSFGLQKKFEFAKNVSRRRVIDMTETDRSRIESIYAPSNKALRGRVDKIETYGYW